jgi:hypothetical protein
MHHDTQPLISWRSNYGIINQLRTLRKAGALYTQVLMLSPSPGSKWYGDTYSSGLAFSSVGGQKIEQWFADGNYVVASKHARPWIKQLSILAAYTYFFNPLRLLLSLIWSKSYIPHSDDETRPADEIASHSLWRKANRWIYLKVRAQCTDAGMQLLGMAGLVRTYIRTLPWAWQLFRGPLKRYDHPPLSSIPMRDPIGRPASHALPGTELSTSPALPILAGEHACSSKAA